MLYIYDEEGAVMVLDGDLKQSHSVKASITEFPLEDGSFTHDHSILKPKIFSVSCGVTEVENPLDVLDSLEKFRDERELLSLQTNLKLYESFMIEGIDTLEETSAGELVMFSLVFKEVKFSKSKQVKIERTQLKNTSAKDKLQSKQNRGSVDHKKIEIVKEPVVVSTTEVTKSSQKEVAVVKQDNNESMLYRIFK